MGKLTIKRSGDFAFVVIEPGDLTHYEFLIYKGNYGAFSVSGSLVPGTARIPTHVIENYNRPECRSCLDYHSVEARVYFSSEAEQFFPANTNQWTVQAAIKAVLEAFYV